MVEINPYCDTPDTLGFLRTFSVDIDPAELIWHRDHQDRTITVIEGNEWRIQMDNCFPRLLNKGDSFQIPSGEYHRLIAGKKDLKLLIIEK